MPPPAPVPTAASVPSEAERRVPPEFYGVEYDKLHEEVLKNLTGAIGSWQKKKLRAEVEIAKAANNPYAAAVIEATKKQIDDVTAKAAELSDVVQIMIGRGRGHYSKTQLQYHKATMEKLFRAEKVITSQTTILVAIGRLPRWNRDPCP